MTLTSIETAIAGWLIVSLCSLIVFFLYRLLGQFDTLNKTVVQLNATMLKIDKDLTTKIAVLESTQATHGSELRNMDKVYDRIRAVENDIGKINVAGCEHKRECKI